MFLLAVLLAVAMASSTLPRARILIRVPPYMVKEGSKVFFNGRFFGRLVTSQWPGDETAIKQFGKGPCKRTQHCWAQHVASVCMVPQQCWHLLRIV